MTAVASFLTPLTVFDIETTGLDPKKGHRIIEIAGVRIENGRILETPTFVSMVNPDREIPFEAKQVNKISDADVKNAPRIEAVLPKFLDFAKGSTLIAHNAQFDFGFLETEKEYCWGYIDLPECLCSRNLSQSVLPMEFRHNLDALCQRFQLTAPGGRHRALGDAMLTAQAILKLIENGNIRSFDELKRRAAMRLAVSGR